jgi:hypothetical protein
LHFKPGVPGEVEKEGVVMLFRISLTVILAVGAFACGGGLEDCGDTSGRERVEVTKNAQMTDSEFLQGASVGGVSEDNRRSVTFISEMPLCVCSRYDVYVYGDTTKVDPNADVTVFVSLVSNAEGTPIEVKGPTDGLKFTWDQKVPLKTKGHGALSYGFSLLITYSFPSVGSEQDDVAELRRIISDLSCTGKYYTFTNEPCSTS